MALLDRQRRATELGRIRLGAMIQTDPTKRARPMKLDTFRLTSPDRTKLEVVAATYGGEVRPWQAPTGPAWEVVTTTAALPVTMPPGEPISQFYEMWPGGNCTQRCDGVTEQFSNSPCKCPADLEQRKELAAQDPPAACKPRTRLSLILADVPGLGVWVLTSTGDQAADELAGVADLMHQAAVRGVMLPATLRLTKRQTKNRGQTKNYVVPVLDIAESFGALMRGEYDRTALDAGRQHAALPSAQPAEVSASGENGGPVIDGSIVDQAGKMRAQQIADEALDPVATLADARQYWQIAAAEHLLTTNVRHDGMTGQLGDLLTVHMSLLAGQAVPETGIPDQ